MNLAIIFNTIWVAALSVVRYFDFKGPKSSTIDAWYSCTTTILDLRPNCALNKKVEENRPPFFSKQMDVCSLQLLDQSHSLASNYDPLWWEYFTHNFFMILAPKSKYLEKNYRVITLLRFLAMLPFKISIKLCIGLKIGNLKMLSKNSISSTQSATLAIRWHLCPKMSNIKMKKCILRVKFWAASNLTFKIFF